MTGPALAARAKTGLQSRDLRAYTFRVAETTAARASRPWNSLADNRLPAVFFRPNAFVRLFQWRALAEGTPSGVPVSRDTGPRTPKPCACHHRFAAVMAGFISAISGGRTMRHIPAHPEQVQSPSPTELANRALRAAALAPTVFDALDIVADALQALAVQAAFQPAEANHHA